MFAAAVLGIALPGFESLPAWLVMGSLMVTLYFSYFRVNPRQAVAPRHRNILLYVATRFLLLPVVFWWASLFLFPEMSAGVLLLFLAPAGVSSPSFANILDGNVRRAIGILIISSLLSVVSIPLLFSLLEGSQLPVDAWALLRFILVMLGAPFLLFHATKSLTAVRSFANGHGRLVSIIFTASVIAMVLGHERQSIFARPAETAAYLAIIFGFYFFFFSLAWFWPLPSHAERVSFSVCSGFNNTGLVLALAFSHIPHAVYFLVLTQFPWACGLWIYRTTAKFAGPGTPPDFHDA